MKKSQARQHTKKAGIRCIRLSDGEVTAPLKHICLYITDYQGDGVVPYTEEECGFTVYC